MLLLIPPIALTVVTSECKLNGWFVSFVHGKPSALNYGFGTKLWLCFVVHVFNTQTKVLCRFGPEISADLGEAENTRT